METLYHHIEKFEPAFHPIRSLNSGSSPNEKARVQFHILQQVRICNSMKHINAHIRNIPVLYSSKGTTIKKNSQKSHDFTVKPLKDIIIYSKIHVSSNASEFTF